VANEKDRDKENLKDYEGGYGGGRERVEQMHEHVFGERGWSTRGGDDPSAGEPAGDDKPQGVHETHGPDWQEKFVSENADKYGQAGGQPIEQRGGSQSFGGVPEEEGFGDTRNVSPRGGVGIRETEKWPETGEHHMDHVIERKK
jgi:hypothetical protein